MSDIFDSEDVEIFMDELLRQPVHNAPQQAQHPALQQQPRIYGVDEWMDLYLPNVVGFGRYRVIGETAPLRSFRRTLVRLASQEGSRNSTGTDDYFASLCDKGVMPHMNWIGAGCCNANEYSTNKQMIRLDGVEHYFQNLSKRKGPTSRIIDYTWKQFFIKGQINPSHSITDVSHFPPFSKAMHKTLEICCRIAA